MRWNIGEDYILSDTPFILNYKHFGFSKFIVFTTYLDICYVYSKNIYVMYRLIVKALNLKKTSYNLG
jgi:hypothetical protein